MYITGFEQMSYVAGAYDINVIFGCCSGNKDRLRESFLQNDASMAGTKRTSTFRAQLLEINTQDTIVVNTYFNETRGLVGL